ncbi:MAG: 4'-phosphopantetheinyl transferase superfamily protein [Trueperaceae bacterium]|nr:4'-phosphopantetheinyl transferase superfamily protein [Trueperaceae bacterium]
MIVAVGLDLVELWRIRRSLERFPDRFVARVFHPDELAALDGRTDLVPGLAARFAAKEAFQKCWAEPFGWRDVWVVKEGARPTLRMAPRLERACREQGLVAHLSLTHGRDHAAAVVVLERVGAAGGGTPLRDAGGRGRETRVTLTDHATFD